MRWEERAELNLQSVELFLTTAMVMLFCIDGLSGKEKDNEQGNREREVDDKIPKEGGGGAHFNPLSVKMLWINYYRMNWCGGKCHLWGALLISRNNVLK